ncbi:N/A [soil metagenome]
MSTDPKRIAIFRMGHLGDTIVSLPALWTVRHRFPNSEIVFLVQEHNVGSSVQLTDILRPGTVYDKVVAYTLGAGGVSILDAVKTLIQLRMKKVDMLVYIPCFRTPAQLNRDKKFFKLAGVKSIVGMSGFLHTDYRPQGDPLPEVPHEADLLLKHLADDGVSTNEDPYSLMHMGLSYEERAFGAKWLADNGIDTSKPIIGVGPGSKMLSKLWPVERFVEVCQALEAKFDATFILFGSPGERDVCQQVVDGLQNGHNAAGAFSVRQSAAMFEHCQLYVGNDTGTMHIAASAGVRCVALFSARDWRGRWYPYGKNHVVHREYVPCEGCLLKICDKDNLCLTKISAQTVSDSALKALGEVLEDAKVPG